MASHTVVELSRWQFAITALFHMTFPAITVGLSVFLAAIYTAYVRTANPLYLQIYRFWKKIFAVGFGLGVVAGTVLTFEFGLNWGVFSHAVGPIVGVAIGMEVLTAFFLEAGFIGIVLYGDGRIRPGMMAFANWMVALGTILSTTWILSANSWMQDPAGYKIVNGQYQVTNWWKALANPSFVWRFPHMLVGVMIGAAWLICGLGAWYLVKGRALAFARRTVSVSLAAVTILLPLQLWLGDNTASFDVVHQPSKFQAFEGNWTSNNNGYNLVVIPDNGHGVNRLAISIPHLGALFGHDLTGQTPNPGLLQTAKADRPNMWGSFYGFRAMFFVELLMFGAVFASVWLRARHRLWSSRRFHKLLLWMTPAGVVAILGGWVLAEAGRQPWVVFGQVTTAAAVSHLSFGEALGSLLGFVALYAALLGVWVVYIVRTVRTGPEGLEVSPPTPAETQPDTVAIGEAVLAPTTTA